MLNNIRALIEKHRLGCFTTGCVVVALAMTTLSLRIYQMSGAIQLDLSRPGYEKVRTQVKKEADDHPFSSTGPLDNAAVQDFDSRIDKYRKELQELGTFDQQQLSDENLGLTAEDTH